jgi:hypothetical protein
MQGTAAGEFASTDIVLKADAIAALKARPKLVRRILASSSSHWQVPRSGVAER